MSYKVYGFRGARAPLHDVRRDMRNIVVTLYVVFCRRSIRRTDHGRRTAHFRTTEYNWTSAGRSLSLPTKLSCARPENSRQGAEVERGEQSWLGDEWCLSALQIFPENARDTSAQGQPRIEAGPQVWNTHRPSPWALFCKQSQPLNVRTRRPPFVRVYLAKEKGSRKFRSKIVLLENKEKASV